MSKERKGEKSCCGGSGRMEALQASASCLRESAVFGSVMGPGLRGVGLLGRRSAPRSLRTLAPPAVLAAKRGHIDGVSGP